MAYFFNGQKHETPAVLSRVDDSAMLNQAVGVGNVLALIGRSSGGKPLTPIEFGSPEDARSVLYSGDLLDAVVRAFDPSAETGAPSKVVAIRVNPAIQSTLLLKDVGSATVVTLTSTGYGLRENQIKAKVENATTRGRKLTTQRVNDTYTQDDVYRDAFKIRYSGAQATGVMSVTPSQVVLQAPSGTAVATIPLADFPTIQELVDRINVVPGFAASVLDGNGEKPALNGLDTVTTQDVKTADYVASAHLQAIVDWFNGNSEGLVTAQREEGVGTLPAPIPFTYLTGGSDGVVTNTEWVSAFTALQLVDVQWITPLTSDPNVHAMTDAHVAFMSGVGRKERRAACGTPLATTEAAAVGLAKAINSDRTSLIHLGGYDYNAKGEMVLFPPYIVAAMFAAGFCGLTPGNAMTNVSLKLRGVERKLRNPIDTDLLITGGVVPIEDTPTGYRVVKSISTWRTNDKFNRVEQSTGCAVDFTVRSLREALEPFKGKKVSPQLLGTVETAAATTLDELSKPEPTGLGVLVGDNQSKPWRKLRVRAVGDAIEVSVEVSPGVPANFIAITVSTVPYAGSVG